jgi:hypothetical protein
VRSRIMQVQTDLRAGGRKHKCGHCGFTAFSYNDVLNHSFNKNYVYINIVVIDD